MARMHWLRRVVCLLAARRCLASLSPLVAGPRQLTLEAADAMASAALREAAAREFNDVSVSVVDASGRELVHKAHPGCPRLIPHLARAKAGCVIGLHAPTRAVKDKYLPEKLAQLLGTTVVAAAATPTNFVAVPGGVLCRDPVDGAVVGAIGVSGASSDEDEHCAVVGAAAAGLATEPASSPLDDVDDEADDAVMEEDVDEDDEDVIEEADAEEEDEEEEDDGEEEEEEDEEDADDDDDDDDEYDDDDDDEEEYDE